MNHVVIGRVTLNSGFALYVFYGEFYAYHILLELELELGVVIMVLIGLGT